MRCVTSTQIRAEQPVNIELHTLRPRHQRRQRILNRDQIRHQAKAQPVCCTLFTVRIRHRATRSGGTDQLRWYPIDARYLLNSEPLRIQELRLIRTDLHTLILKPATHDRRFTIALRRIRERTLDALRLLWCELTVGVDDGVGVATCVEELRTELLSANARTNGLFCTADRALSHWHTRHDEHWHVPQWPVRPKVDALLIDQCCPLAVNVPPLDSGRVEDLDCDGEPVDAGFCDKPVGVAIE